MTEKTPKSINKSNNILSIDYLLLIIIIGCGCKVGISVGMAHERTEVNLLFNTDPPGELQ